MGFMTSLQLGQLSLVGVMAITAVALVTAVGPLSYTNYDFGDGVSGSSSSSSDGVSHTGIIPQVYAAAETLAVFTDNTVYSDGSPLFVYGKAFPQENLIVRLITPDQNIAKFHQIVAEDDGSFSYLLLQWPNASINFPYGTYVIEVISPDQNGLSEKTEVKFLATTDLVEVPIQRQVGVAVFVPETAGVEDTIRIFVQITNDGLLVGGSDLDVLLQTSHVHLPNGDVEGISSSFATLHNGLYYADYEPEDEGTYVFHIVSYYQGSVSHGSAATSVLSHGLGGISQEISKLNTILDETSTELDVLKSDVSEFERILDAASGNIDRSVEAISDSVVDTVEASAQLNSLLFPIVGSIGIIVALQIAILARRR